MLPKLYNKNETNFVHNGLGLLTGSIEVIATEELNGMFELRIEYDSEGFLANIIQEEMIIKAKANDKQDEQLFRIYSITKNHENDNLVIDAQHITYDLGNNFVEKLEARNLTKRQVMQLIGSSTNYEHPFNVTSSNTTTQSSTSLYRTNPLQMIAGIEGSILQIWGGQIERDNFNLIMHDRRGSDDGVLVTYKKNLTGLEAKFDIENLVTRIFPFVFKEATDDEPERLITVSGKYVDSLNVNDYEMPYILPIDYSSDDRINTDGTDAQIRTQLTNLANAYFNETGKGKPTVEMEVQFEHLWETEEYKDVAALELVGMGDTITVEHSKLGVEGTAVVNRIEYDVIARKNRSVDVGNVRASFTDRVNEVSNIVDRVDEIDKNANQAIRSANGKNTIYYGADEPTDGNKDDIWFRVVDGEYTRTYRFDGIQWQLIMSKDIADIEETASSARNRANEAVEKAELATSNANEAISEAQTAFDEAQDALSAASNAENIATTVGELATALDTTVSGHTTQITDIEGELSRKMTTIDADNKYATQSALQQTSQSLSSDIVAVQGNLDALEIGGRNLVLGTSDEYEIYSSAGRWGDYRPYERIPITPGETYTVSAYLNALDTNGDSVFVKVRMAGSTYVDFDGNHINDGEEGYSRVTFTVPEGWDELDLMVIRFNVAGGDYTRTVKYKEVQIEKGNKVTDWSPAPEDIDYQFSSINQTVSDITTQVGNHEGELSSIQQTVGSFATRIENTEGDVSTLTQTAQGLQNRVSDAEGNISTVTQLADTLQSDLRDAEGNINTLTETASSMQRTISSVRDDLDGIEIGGRNLITHNPVNWSNGVIYTNGNTAGLSTAIRMSSYGEIKPNTEYVITNYTLESTMLRWREYDQNQNINLGEQLNIEPGESITFVTSNNGYYFRVYFNFEYDVLPDGLGFDYFAQLEKGNKVTDWTPAPEDIATQSQFTQLSNNINARVEKGDVINQINIDTSGVLISGKKLILDGDTTVTGTFRVANANITSVDAGKMTTGTLDAAQVSVINLSANSIVGGILQSQNSNTTFNLNTGVLTMRNANFTLGNGARIDFTSTSNRIQFRSTDGGIVRSSGVGVGRGTSGYPFAYVGTTGASDLDTLSEYFSGVIVSTTRAIDDGGTNSFTGRRWQFRNTATGYDRGMTFDWYGSPSISFINGHDFNYTMGSESAPLENLYNNNVYSRRYYIDNPNPSSDFGYVFKIIRDDLPPTFYPKYGGANNYYLGSSVARWHRVYMRNSPEVSSDERMKSDITDIDLGLDFINDLEPKSFLLNLNEDNKRQFGVIAQQLKTAFIKHGVNTDRIGMLSQGEDGMYGVQYEQFIPTLIKSNQELDLKIDTEVAKLDDKYTILEKQYEQAIFKIASLEERLNKLEVA